MNNSDVLVLGSGGHGWQALSQFIYDYNGNIDCFFQTVDYGGSGGIWYRLLEYNNFELNKKLHAGKIKPILPWGDINKVLTHFFVHKHGSLGGKILDFRSDDLHLHLKEIDILSHLLGMEISVEKSFITYFKTAFEYYKNHRKDIDYINKKEFCLGYVWQDFLHWNLEKVPELSLFYRQYKILPENLKLYFTSDNRQILEAQTLSAKPIFGEDKIDKSKLKIKPESFKIKNVSKIKTIFNDEFLKSLELVQVIIIPPGSVSNWLPLLNYPKIASALSQKNVIWIVNPTTAINELSPKKYLEFFDSKFIKPVIVGSVGLLENINVVDLESEDKYNDKSVSRALLNILGIK